MPALHNVSLAFGATQALDNLSLTISPEQTTVLIGPSGCGKSTVLRLLVGLVRPDSGEVQFNGEPLNAANIQTVRHSVGYVIQEGGLFPHLSARQNITLLARHLKFPAERIEGRLAELLELTRFPAAGLDRFPAELSGGQRQRVSLMRALMPDPQVLLLDEPLGALDPMIRSDLQADLRAIFRRLNKTVLMVTHDMGEAAYLADTIVLMHNGRVAQSGSLADFVERPAGDFVRAFINAQRSPLGGLHSG